MHGRGLHGRQQADSIIFNFFSAASPTGMFSQLPTDLSAQQSLLSSLDRQLPSEAQQACEGAEQGIMLDELQAALKLSAHGKSRAQTACPMSSSPSSGRCWQSCKMPFKLSMASAWQPSSLKGSSICCKRSRAWWPVKTFEIRVTARISAQDM